MANVIEKSTEGVASIGKVPDSWHFPQFTPIESRLPLRVRYYEFMDMYMNSMNRFRRMP